MSYLLGSAAGLLAVVVLSFAAGFVGRALRDAWLYRERRAARRRNVRKLRDQAARDAFGQLGREMEADRSKRSWR